MAEFHEEMIGRSKSENYMNAVNRVNHEYNKKLENKSFWVNASTIEDERKAALRKVEENFYGRVRGGGMIE